MLSEQDIQELSDSPLTPSEISTFVRYFSPSPDYNWLTPMIILCVKYPTTSRALLLNLLKEAD